MDRSFAGILDECLDRVLLRGETVDACMADYPEHATELRQTLEASLTVHRAASFQPDQARKRASQIRFLEAVEQQSPQHWLRGWLSSRLIGTRSRVGHGHLGAVARARHGQHGHRGGRRAQYSR